ncbi:hypothetical protein TeGR_g2814, partial [Tetraparma gracilis]
KGKGKGGRGGKSVSSSAKAGLQFPVARFTRYLRRDGGTKRVSPGAGVYAAAVAEYGPFSSELLKCMLDVLEDDSHFSESAMTSRSSSQSDEMGSHWMQSSMPEPSGTVFVFPLCARKMPPLLPYFEDLAVVIDAGKEALFYYSPQARTCLGRVLFSSIKLVHVGDAVHVQGVDDATATTPPGQRAMKSIARLASMKSFRNPTPLGDVPEGQPSPVAAGGVTFLDSAKDLKDPGLSPSSVHSQPTPRRSSLARSVSVKFGSAVASGDIVVIAMLSGPSVYVKLYPENHGEQGGFGGRGDDEEEGGRWDGKTGEEQAGLFASQLATAAKVPIERKGERMASAATRSTYASSLAKSFAIREDAEEDTGGHTHGPMHGRHRSMMF